MQASLLLPAAACCCLLLLLLYPLLTARAFRRSIKKIYVSNQGSTNTHRHRFKLIVSDSTKARTQTPKGNLEGNPLTVVQADVTCRVLFLAIAAVAVAIAASRAPFPPGSYIHLFLCVCVVYMLCSLDVCTQVRYWMTRLYPDTTLVFVCFSRR